MDKVEFRKVEKQLRRVPFYVVEKLKAWAISVETKGIAEVRKIPGYHDEPLKGQRCGERSIRLTRSYRAIYTETHDGNVNLILLEEVNKHGY